MLPTWTTAVPDWEKRIVNRESLIPFAPLFPESAREAMSTFTKLRIVDAPGSPTIGEACADWVMDFASAIFGAYDPDTGIRHIREFFLLISKKNSKALALDTPIPTPSGWATMGELEPGHIVLGADGSPTEVLAVSEVFHGHDCYQLEFSNGEKVIADAGHLWATWSIQGGSSVYGTYTTEELLKTLYTAGDNLPNHYLPVSGKEDYVFLASVKPCVSVPTKCIRVAAEDHLFLFGRTMLPTHNSTIAGGIMLTALIKNWRESGEFIILAPTVEVAQNAYNPVRDMIKKDPTLEAMFQVQDHIRTVTSRITGATLKVVAADTSTVSGKKAIGILVDELWEFGKNPNADKMLLEATGGLASRPEGFIIYLTTQSDKPPAGVFRTKLHYARKVRDGIVDNPKFLAVLYEHPQYIIKANKHIEPDNFYMTNPNLGLSVDETYLRDKLAQAKEEGQSSLVIFLAKHVNVEIGQALQTDRWAGTDFWQARGDKKWTFERMLKECEVICAGIDGGGLDDLLGLAMVGRLKGTTHWVHWARAWAHESVLERRKSEATTILDFEKDGELWVVKRMGEDVEECANYVGRVERSGLLYQVGLDPSGIGAVLDALEGEKVPADKIVGVSQGWKLGGAIKTTERKLAEEALTHCGQGLMAWCVANARVEPRANSILITKQVSGACKIDPLMATFNAISLISLNPPSQTEKFQMFIL
jgi:phage terminase large subunit-like protein